MPEEIKEKRRAKGEEEGGRKKVKIPLVCKDRQFSIVANFEKITAIDVKSHTFKAQIYVEIETPPGARLVSKKRPRAPTDYFTTEKVLERLGDFLEISNSVESETMQRPPDEERVTKYFRDPLTKRVTQLDDVTMTKWKERKNLDSTKLADCSTVMVFVEDPERTLGWETEIKVKTVRLDFERPEVTTKALLRQLLDKEELTQMGDSPFIEWLDNRTYENGKWIEKKQEQVSWKVWARGNVAEWQHHLRIPDLKLRIWKTKRPQSNDTQGVDPRLHIFFRYKVRLTGVFSEEYELQNFPYDYQHLSVKLTWGASHDGTFPFMIKPSKRAGLDDSDETTSHFGTVRKSVYPRESGPVIEKIGTYNDDGKFVEEHEKEHVENIAVAMSASVAGIYSLSPSIAFQPGVSDPKLSSSKKTYPLVIIQGLVKRRNGFFFWNVHMPMFFMVICAGLSMCVPIEDGLGDRLGVTLGMFLAASAYKFVVAGFVPVVGYVTLLDQYVIMCFITIFLIAVENTYIVQFGDSRQEMVFAWVFVAYWAVFHIWYAYEVLNAKKAWSLESTKGFGFSEKSVEYQNNLMDDDGIVSQKKIYRKQSVKPPKMVEWEYKEEEAAPPQKGAEKAKAGSHPRRSQVTPENENGAHNDKTSKTRGGEHLKGPPMTALDKALLQQT